MFCFLLLQTTMSYNPFHKSHLTNKQVYFTRQQEVLVKGTDTKMRLGRVWMPQISWMRPSAISTSCAPHQKQHRAQRAPGFVLIHRKGWAQGLLISPSSCLPKRNWKRDRKYSIFYNPGTQHSAQHCAAPCWNSKDYLFSASLRSSCNIPKVQLLYLKVELTKSRKISETHSYLSFIYLTEWRKTAITRHCGKKEMATGPGVMCCIPTCPSEAQPEVLAQFLTQHSLEEY